ncbi:hypothetical protein LTR95_011639 [Oleoguttula sp. CCFEE 5521]
MAPTFGAIVVPTADKQTNAMAVPMLDSPALTPVVTREPPYSYTDDKAVPPHSPFYQHPPASHERMPPQTPPSKKASTKSFTGVYEKDLESGPATPLSGNDELNPFTSKVSVDHNKECTMWPSRKTLELNRLAERKQKLGTKKMGFAGTRHRWATATSRQKWIVRIALAVVVVGAIVAIAVGVTHAVHGGVYSGEGQTKQIGDGD